MVIRWLKIDETDLIYIVGLHEVNCSDSTIRVLTAVIHSLHEIISTVCDFPYKIMEKFFQ